MKRGSTRWVLFIGNYAYKIPSLKNISQFKWGLIANKHESNFYKAYDKKNKICPVVFSIPFGLLIVMPKIRVVKDNELSKEYLTQHCTEPGYIIPAELKCDSFGYLNSKLVVIDYG